MEVLFTHYYQQLSYELRTGIFKEPRFTIMTAKATARFKDTYQTLTHFYPLTASWDFSHDVLLPFQGIKHLFLAMLQPITALFLLLTSLILLMLQLTLAPFFFIGNGLLALLRYPFSHTKVDPFAQMNHWNTQYSQLLTNNLVAACNTVIVALVSTVTYFIEGLSQILLWPFYLFFKSIHTRNYKKQARINAKQQRIKALFRKGYSEYSKALTKRNATIKNAIHLTKDAMVEVKLFMNTYDITNNVIENKLQMKKNHKNAEHSPSTDIINEITDALLLIYHNIKEERKEKITFSKKPETFKIQIENRIKEIEAQTEIIEELYSRYMQEVSAEISKKQPISLEKEELDKSSDRYKLLYSF